MNPKYLFEAADLLKDKSEEKVIVLDRIENIDPKPTITIRINDGIRSMQRRLFKRYNEPVFRLNKGKNSKKFQEMYIDSDKESYACELVDLCVINSSGLFETHTNDLLKKVFVKQVSFMDYFVSVITEAFSGSLEIAEDEDKEVKN